MSKRKTTTPEPFPKSRQMIADGIEEALFDAFGMEPPAGNSRPIHNAGKPPNPRRRPTESTP